MKTTMISSLLAGSTFIAAVHASCGHLTSVHRRAEAIEKPAFGYEGTIGPLNWASLKPENALCSTGTTQSPIDLVTNNITHDEGSNYKINIPNTEGSDFENLGTTVEVLVTGTLETPVKNYTMKQFHFHTPSEHRIDGEYFPMETHFVFEAADKSIAVVSFLIGLGENDPLFGTVIPSVASIAELGQTVKTPPLNFAGLQSHLSANSVFRYVGSLTTPPCSEKVDWIISTKPLTVDATNFEMLKKVVGFNSRYTQAPVGQANLLTTAALTHPAEVENKKKLPPGPK